MAPLFLNVNIPINGPADVICLIIVLIFCIFAVKIIRGFFKKPTVKNKDMAGGDNSDNSRSDSGR